jgi:hypothetical protein
MANYTVEVTDIEYDIDHDLSIGPLPSTLTLEIENVDDVDELEYRAGDAISNETGFCHFGFNMKIISVSE